MRVARISFVVLILGLASAIAAIPEKRPWLEYENLWEDSPFTNKPIPKDESEPPPNPLEDYTLASVCQVESGWHVILLHKKDRAKRLRLTPYQSADHGFKVISVEAPQSRQAKVEIDADGQRGWVQFEAEFLNLKKPTPRASLAKNKVSPKKYPPIPGLNSSKVRKKPIKK